jgi:hypothetical protein
MRNNIKKGNMNTITKSELIEKINNIKGTTFISIDIESDPKMRKTNNPYYGAIKTSTLSGAINYDYENSVNNQLDREGKERNFEAQSRKWGTHNGNWIIHNDNHYLHMKVQSNSNISYILNGDNIDIDLLKPFLPEHKKPNTQEALEKEIVCRDIKIDNIKKIRLNGDEYKIKN